MTESGNGTGDHLPRRASPDPTGDAGVDSTMARLEGIDPQTDPAKQLSLLMAVHDELQRRLTATEA